MTKAKLRAVPNLPTPDLPDHPDGFWHPMTLAWWRDVWSSPMAPEFDSSDTHGLFALAYLTNDFWSASSASMRKDLAAELRMQGQRFGLSPIDRRRLQWEIERTEEAKAKGNKRRAAAKHPTKKKDPRAALGA